VLPSVAAELRCPTQIFGVNLEIFIIGCGQQAEEAAAAENSAGDTVVPEEESQTGS